MPWEVSLHEDVERWFLGLCRDEPAAADGVADAIEQLAMMDPRSGDRSWTGSTPAATTT